MKIAVPKEIDKLELRVAASPETVKKFVALGCDVAVEKGAGEASGMTDAAYEKAGATIATAKQVIEKADIILKVMPPKREGANNELVDYPKGSLLIGLLAPLTDTAGAAAYAKAEVNAMAMEMIPRISRAQSMDALSSQSNLAGYRAVIDGAAALAKAMPMMMTAAGTVTPAKVLILGAGVAGLQAIATAKRLGAVVSAFDVRPAVKEQVQSLGASFVEVAADEVSDAETKGGYAKEMSEDYKKRQAEAIHQAIAAADLVISTALIPGKPAPILITKAMVADMKHGSIIVDLAAPMGGNCEYTQTGKTISKDGVTIIGRTDLISSIAADASQLFARNIYNLLALMIEEGGKAIKFDRDDEIIRDSLLTLDGKVVNERVATVSKEAPAAKKAAPARKTATRKPAAKKAGATKKTAAKKTAAKKPAAKKSAASKAGAPANDTPASDTEA